MMDPGLLSHSSHILLSVESVEKSTSITVPLRANSKLKETEKKDKGLVECKCTCKYNFIQDSIYR